MTVRVLPYVPDIAYLDRSWLRSDGTWHLLPAAEVQRVPENDRLTWCVKRARYNLPTVQLVGFLRGRIMGRRAIEIGAGMGDLGRHLGIPMTDSAIQATPEMRALYEAAGQATIDPPPDVERLDAAAAIAKYRPQVVVAAWVTQLYQPGDEGPPIVGSCVGGVDELALLDQVEAYIFVGNLGIHEDKRIFAREHSTFEAPWMVSRAFNQNLNRIWMWGA